MPALRSSARALNSSVPALRSSARALNSSKPRKTCAKPRRKACNHRFSYPGPTFARTNQPPQYRAGRITRWHAVGWHAHAVFSAGMVWPLGWYEAEPIRLSENRPDLKPAPGPPNHGRAEDGVAMPPRRFRRVVGMGPYDENTTSPGLQSSAHRVHHSSSHHTPIDPGSIAKNRSEVSFLGLRSRFTSETMQAQIAKGHPAEPSAPLNNKLAGFLPRLWATRREGVEEQRNIEEIEHAVARQICHGISG